MNIKGLLLGALLSFWSSAHAAVGGLVPTAAFGIGAATPLASPPTILPASGTYSSAQSVTIFDTTPGATIYYTTDGTVPTTSSSVYSSSVTISTTTTLKAIAIATGYANSAVTTAVYTISAGTDVFPKIGIQAIAGNQYFPTANLQQLAQYGMIVMGGDYITWPSQNASNGGYSTRDAVVVGLKTQTHTGKNALTPIVLQYENANDQVGTASPCSMSPWFPELANTVVSDNWFVWQSGSSGTKAANNYFPNCWMLNWGHVVGTDSGTGLYPGQYVGYQEYNVFYAGTGLGGSAMASTHLDGIYNDVLPGYWLKGSGNADPLRNGTNPSATDPTTISAQSVGKAEVATELQGLWPGVQTAANTASLYAFPSSCGLGISTSTNNMAGHFTYNMSQFAVGTAASPNALNCMGLSTFESNVALAETQLASGGAMQLTGAFTSTDYQNLRYGLTAILMRNNWLFVGYGSNDVVTPENTSTYPVFDEFWGGNLNVAGYLGAASDPVQTSAYSNGVWCRQFVSGVACVNPAGNGTRTITLPGGHAWYPLNGTQDHTANPGGTAVTTLTLAAGDGRILVTTGPNYRPTVHVGGNSRLERNASRPAANDDFFVQLVKAAI
ncbi:MAG: chitobiase/beta-hexosaminidase C-terminal domain-containing protein [Patescibacteria group bacterium]|nr:chitobiase/beta-hexosaminidase C-terminal domain-containing protein [Patescibacteria group bacterium]